jgi:serine/threonine protein kinase
MPSPLPANIVDAAALADELARYRVVVPGRLREAAAALAGAGAVAQAEHLVRRGALTVFQAEQALTGGAPRLVLGPYRLTGTAGQGTFGPLFAARHASRPGEFAVRVLPLRSLWKARQAKQLARTLAAGVNHPAVVPLLDADSANGFHYLVWSNDPGAGEERPHAAERRLADSVAACGPLEPPEAVALLGQLVAAVSACHARGVMYGAITPQSVAVLEGGQPRLLELGAGALLAQNVAEDESLFDTMSAALASANVLAFAAPELVAAPAELTAAADQYALGAAGYFALTGLPPYPHPMLSDQLRAKRAGAPPSAAVVNPAVPAELAELLGRMMAPAPGERFATLDEVGERLAAVSTSSAGAHDMVAPVSPSELRRARPSSGSIAWVQSQSGTLRAAKRDDTDASITFELPEQPQSDAPPAEPRGSAAAAYRANVATPPGFAFFAAPAPVQDPEPEAEPEPPQPRAPDSRPPTAPAPVVWHTAEPEAAGAGAASAVAPPSGSVVWKKLKRNLLFWQAATDTVQVSVYGPHATPGRASKLLVFLHTADAAESVRTLSRAFLEGAELVGSGSVAREVARGAELAVHLSVANAGVAKALLKCQWRGQPHRLSFDLHVPWESPEGVSPGLVSVGLDNLRIGKVEFGLNILPRKA